MLACVCVMRATSGICVQDMCSIVVSCASQARGRALLNLRMTEMEGGLLGRTLVTLVSNKGYTGSGKAPELPHHKLSSHDVVALRPNKGTGEGPPLCSGDMIHTCTHTHARMHTYKLVHTRCDLYCCESGLTTLVYTRA